MEIKKYDLQKIREILDEVRVCTLLCCTQNGKVYSPAAEEYIKWLEGFAQYCIPEMKNNWGDTIRKIIYSVAVAKPQFDNDPDIEKAIFDNENAIIDSLYNFMNAAQIMKIYDETHSWKYVGDMLKEQGHSGWTFSGLANILIQYSLMGVDFIEKFDPNRIKRDNNFKEYYYKASEYITARQTLNKKLVQIIS